MPFASGDGVNLVLDGLDHPRMSFETATQGLGYAWCNTDCESDNATWDSQEVESQASLANDYEVLPIRRCTVSTWFNGQRSSLALDLAGNPRIAYDAQHWWVWHRDRERRTPGVQLPGRHRDPYLSAQPAIRSTHEIDHAWRRGPLHIRACGAVGDIILKISLWRGYGTHALFNLLS